MRILPYVLRTLLVGSIQLTGNPCRYEAGPGVEKYPRALADNLTRHPVLNLWAYVSSRELYISLHQIAGAMGREPAPQFREELQKEQDSFLLHGLMERFPSGREFSGGMLTSGGLFHRFRSFKGDDFSLRRKW